MVYQEHFKTLDAMIQSSSAVSTEEDANKLKKEIASFESFAADFDTKFMKES